MEWVVSECLWMTENCQLVWLELKVSLDHHCHTYLDHHYSVDNSGIFLTYWGVYSVRSVHFSLWVPISVAEEIEKAALVRLRLVSDEGKVWIVEVDDLFSDKVRVRMVKTTKQGLETSAGKIFTSTFLMNILYYQYLVVWTITKNTIKKNTHMVNITATQLGPGDQIHIYFRTFLQFIHDLAWEPSQSWVSL